MQVVTGELVSLRFDSTSAMIRTPPLMPLAALRLKSVSPVPSGRNVLLEPLGRKPAATPLDDKDEALLARFPGVPNISKYPARGVTGKKGKKDQARRRATPATSALQTLEHRQQTTSLRSPASVACRRHSPGSMSVACHGASFIRLMAHAAEFGAAATEVMQRRRAATAEQEDEQRAETAEEEDEDDDAADAICAGWRWRGSGQPSAWSSSSSSTPKPTQALTAPSQWPRQEAAAAAPKACSWRPATMQLASLECAPSYSRSAPFQAMHGDESLGYFETAEEAALVYARRAAPGKAAKVAREIEKEREAREAAARAEARAEVRAQRQAAAKAKADAAAALRTQPPNKVGTLISIARYAAFAHEFTVPELLRQILLRVQCLRRLLRQHLCPFKHEMPRLSDQSAEGCLQ